MMSFTILKEKMSTNLRYLEAIWILEVNLKLWISVVHFRFLFIMAWRTTKMTLSYVWGLIMCTFLLKVTLECQQPLEDLQVRRTSDIIVAKPYLTYLPSLTLWTQLSLRTPTHCSMTESEQDRREWRIEQINFASGCNLL